MEIFSPIVRMFLRSDSGLITEPTLSRGLTRSHPFNEPFAVLQASCYPSARCWKCPRSSTDLRVCWFGTAVESTDTLADARKRQPRCCVTEMGASPVVRSSFF
jgi:hypothetical protein